MRIRTTLLSCVAALAVSAAPHEPHPCAEDSALIAQEFLQLQALLQDHAAQLEDPTDYYKRHAHALEMAQATEAWLDHVRTLWPSEETWLSYVLYSTITAAVCSSQPGGAAYYQPQALLMDSDTPYRPALYAEVVHVNELAEALARAKEPKRGARLAAKLRVACAALSATEGAQ